MIKIVFVRHGQSEWNKSNKFTGWTDVDLTEQGIEEARKAGKILKKEGYEFDVAFDSLLVRANRTLDLIQEEMGTDLPVKKSWRLNERHYGALQGFNKSEMAAKEGEDQVHIWRRSYDVPPPALTQDDERWPGNDPLYKDVPKNELPLTECLKDVVERVLPYWNSEIVPLLKEGKKVIISAHGNSLRAILKYLDNISDEEIPGLNIPTGIPLVYELDDDLKPIRHYYLADPQEVKKAVDAVKNQGKA